MERAGQIDRLAANLRSTAYADLGLNPATVRQTIACTLLPPDASAAAGGVALSATAAAAVGTLVGFVVVVPLLAVGLFAARRRQRGGAGQAGPGSIFPVRRL